MSKTRSWNKKVLDEWEDPVALAEPIKIPEGCELVDLGSAHAIVRNYCEGDWDEFIRWVQPYELDSHLLWEYVQKTRYSAIDVYEPRLYSDTELVERPIARIPTVVDPFMPRGGMGLLYGPGGIGKSFLAQQLAYAVAEGKDFLGFSAVEGRVLYIQADMAGAVQHERVKQLERCTDNLQWLLSPAKPLELWRETDELVEEIRDWDASVVIYDTLRKAHTKDENASDTVQRLYRQARTIFGPEASILFLHHTRKPSQENTGQDHRSFRGSSAWVDDADYAIEMRRPHGNGRKLWMRFEKARICEVPPDREILLNGQTLEFVLLNIDGEESKPDQPTSLGAEKVQVYQDALGVSRATVYRMWEKGELPDLSGA